MPKPKLNVNLTPLDLVEDRIYQVGRRRYLVLNLAQLERLRTEAPHLIVCDPQIGDGEPCVDIGPAN